MNLLGRAKALLRTKSALAIMPLAVALATTAAGAAPILPSSTPACSGPNLLNCTVNGANTPGGGVTFFGGSASLLSGGGSLIVSQSGVMNENAVGSIPVTYSFHVNFLERSFSSDPYSVQLQISQAGGQTFSQMLSQIVTGLDQADFTGFFVLPNVNLVAGLPTTTALILPQPAGTSGSQELSFPNNGFVTFGAPFSSEETATPEPASGALLLLGGAVVYAFRRTRQ